MPTATITSKGQITIPAIVRSTLGVAAGDRVEFVQVEHGRFELVAANSFPAAPAAAAAAAGWVVCCNALCR
jgi:AbrB family looped-hinge helix DNA binding protein